MEDLRFDASFYDDDARDDSNHNRAADQALAARRAQHPPRSTSPYFPDSTPSRPPPPYFHGSAKASVDPRFDASFYDDERDGRNRAAAEDLASRRAQRLPRSPQPHAVELFPEKLGVGELSILGAASRAPLDTAAAPWTAQSPPAAKAAWGTTAGDRGELFPHRMAGSRSPAAEAPNGMEPGDRDERFPHRIAGLAGDNRGVELFSNKLVNMSPRYYAAP